MTKKLDEEAAFARYVAMGSARSYRALGRHFKVNKRTITSAAKRGNWTARLAKIEADAQAQADRKLTESRAEMRERHLKMLRAVASRGIQAIQKNEIEDAMQGAKAIEMVVKLERTIMGEPSERVGFSIEEVTRREVETFLATRNEDVDGPDDY